MRFPEVLYTLWSHKSSCQRIKRSMSVWKSQTNIHTKIIKVFYCLTFKLDWRHSDNIRSSSEVLKWFYCWDFNECSEWMSYVKIEGKWRYVTSHSSLTQFNLYGYFKLQPESLVGIRVGNALVLKKTRHQKNAKISEFRR